MQSTSEGYFDVVDLAKELRSEKLFIQSELEILHHLNEKLEKSALELAQAKWTSTQQRSNLKQLFAQGDVTSSSCVPRTDYVLSPVFVDAHKVLRYQDALVLSEVIQRVRASPAVASLWLTAAEARRPREAGAAARALCSGLYTGGGSGAPRDVAPLRKVLRHLAAHRLATAEDPRRIIGQGSSSFSRLYSELVEGFRPARLFLSAALRGPFLPLLQLDECLLVDPDKALDRIKKYCTTDGSSSECQDELAKLARYRKWTVTSLAAAANRFIVSLTENWACFPPSVAWVVRQTALILRATRRISDADIHSICTDLVFTNFICQAIANPEAYGITDIPITNVGRFNLAQVAQTLQMLCLMKHQEVDRKLRDLYSRFEKDSVYSLLDAIVDDETFSSVSDDGQQLSDVEEELLEGAPCEEQDMDLLKTEPVVNANVALFTRNDLQLLVSLLKKIPLTITNGFDSSPEQIKNSTSSSSNLDQDFKELSIYDKTPASEHSSDSNKTKNNTNGFVNVSKSFSHESGDQHSKDNNGDADTACGVTDENNRGAGDNGMDLSEMLPHDEGLNQLLRCIHPEHVLKLQKLLKRLPDCNFAKESPIQKPITKGKHDGTNGSTSSPVKNGPKKPSPQSQEVLVIKLPGDTAYEPIGLVPESKVLESHYVRSLSEDLLVPCVGSEGTLAQVPHNAGGSANTAGTAGGTGSGIGAGTSVAVGTAGDSGEVRSASLIVETPGAHAGQEKRTRFSLSHDEGSIGNTSDNLEAVSEAASNHSVTSSLEMETEDQNDNLSDMVSANVSGRGSPNISGRDTPSSQVTEGEAGVGPAMPQAQRHVASIPLSSTAAMKQAKLLKRTRHDIEDKFCKFEIKKLIEGDETISIISDTWSTDVLASDSETIGESYDRALITPTLAVGQQNALAVVGQQALPLVQPNQPDVSETASESAWSTDALVSDSDRMTEVDIDECNSIARSDTGTVRSDSEPLPPILQHPTVSHPHHQFSPLNNINRDALLNRRQMCAASSVHTAHPDNTPNMLNNIMNGGLAINTSGENASCEESPEDMALLRSPPTRNVNISPPSFMNSNSAVSNSNALDNNAVVARNTNGHRDGASSFVLRNRSQDNSTRRPVGYHDRVSQALNTNRETAYPESNRAAVNGYSVSPCFSSRTVPDLPAGPSHAPCLDSPLSALDSPGQPAFYQGYRENLARPNLNMNVFDFNQPTENASGVVDHHSILQPEISAADSMFHSQGSAFVEANLSGNPTSRWLNDPSQKFPVRAHIDSTGSPSSSSPSNIASCSNHQQQSKAGTAILRNNIAGHDEVTSKADNISNGLHNGILINNAETVFRPIQVERDSLTKENNHNDRYGNAVQTLSNHANSINGFEDHFVDLPRDQYEIRVNNVDLDYDRNDNTTPNVRMHSSSVMNSQHSFTSSNLVANSIPRVSKNIESRTCIINISSSRIEKSRENKPSEVIENNGCISSGSAISLSTLSVNSADTSTSERSSSQDINSENLTERRISPSPLGKVTILSSGDVKMQRMDSSRIGCSNGSNTLPRNSTMQGSVGSLKPGASTGAIPKSISFDATAEKSHRYHSGRRAVDDSSESSGLNFGDLKNNMKRSGGNLLNKIKLFRNKSRGFASSASNFGKRNTNQDYNEDVKADADCDLDGNSISIVVNRGDDLINSLPSGSANSQKITELSDDILAKYRRKASSSSDAATSDSTSNSGHSAGVTGNRSRGASIVCDDVGNGSDGESPPDGLSDIASDIEFDSLKRKLRLVLSNADIHSFEISNARSGMAALACMLRMENGPGALGVLSGMGARRGRTPLASLRSDSSSRRPYAAYLSTCRRALLSAIAATDSEAEWQRGEALRQAALAAAARARVSLAAREPRLAALQEGLRAGLADDKRDTLAATLAALASDMAAEDAWAGASEWELEQAALTVERAVMSRVYLQAMFPNGDGDILRDQLLHDHISRLSLGEVGLPERRLAGAPWISAQRILAHLPAYKTPRDKVECIVRCVNSIMTMLSMSSEGSAPGADDLTPALVYVLIKANPPSLLSTVQFVSTFLSVPLESEQLYCWTQFCSAVEFIKTMDYAKSSSRR